MSSDSSGSLSQRHKRGYSHGNYSGTNLGGNNASPASLPNVFGLGT